jgi:predicted O-methyltransferase YrrM
MDDQVIDPAHLLLNEIYQSRSVTTSAGEALPLNSEVSAEEGKFLYEIIRSDTAVMRTLEVGCAYGISSLNICSAMRDRPGSKHTIIDPFQKSWWKSVGVTNLRRADLSNFDLLEKKSEFALPILLSEGEEQFDLIFLDGWHTFDHTMTDAFYASRLLKIGGYLVFDDAHWRSVTKVIRYLEQYPSFERYASVPLPNDHFKTTVRIVRGFAAQWPLRTMIRHMNYGIQAAVGPRYSMVALRKTSEDSRSFDWFADF